MFFLRWTMWSKKNCVYSNTENTFKSPPEYTFLHQFQTHHTQTHYHSHVRCAAASVIMCDSVYMLCIRLPPPSTHPPCPDDNGAGVLASSVSFRRLHFTACIKFISTTLRETRALVGEYDATVCVCVCGRNWLIAIIIVYPVQACTSRAGRAVCVCTGAHALSGRVPPPTG